VTSAALEADLFDATVAADRRTTVPFSSSRRAFVANLRFGADRLSGPRVRGPRENKLGFGHHDRQVGILVGELEGARKRALKSALEITSLKRGERREQEK